MEFLLQRMGTYVDALGRTGYHVNLGLSEAWDLGLGLGGF